MTEEIQTTQLEYESLGHVILRRYFRHRLAPLASLAFIFMVGSALLAPLSVYTPTQQEPANSFRPPDSSHWFGTDELGRDVYTRILYGGRISLTVGLLSTTLTLVVGVVVGALAGYYGGWVDNVLMRITDAFLSFPAVLVLILISSLLRDLPFPIMRNSVLVVIVVISALSWMWSARLVRSLVLTVRERDFVTASRALGAHDRRLIFAHILPNCMGPILVNGTLEMASAVILESGLSYLGFGVQPPTPSWGNILASAQLFVYKAPWLAIFPGLMIFISVMSINYIGDGFRDALDPYVIHSSEE
jgi:peptide/nickel transport system permease protein